VFSQIKRGSEVNTSSLLLIDGSGSMHGTKCQTVMRCAYFFGTCLEKCNIPTEVAVFQNSDYGSSAAYQIVKSFDERMSKASNKFTPMADGGTPMAEAMVEAVRRLSVRHEQRKILFVFTDGEPNNEYGDAKSFMVRLADVAGEIYGVETVGMGVDTSRSVAQCFRDFVMLDGRSARDVETNFIKTMRSRVLKFSNGR
jgi:cobalamin biosynthesis protein CobT